MKSLDTNILIYAANADCSEHKKAYSIVEQLLTSPTEWMLSEQVLFEYLRALTNPLIFSSPLTKKSAIKVVKEFKDSSGLSFVCYESTFFNNIMSTHAKSKKDRLYDIILATTLLHNGVTEFYTRNVNDFEGLGFERVINPVD